MPQIGKALTSFRHGRFMAMFRMFRAPATSEAPADAAVAMRKRTRLLFWAVGAALLVGLAGLGQPAEDGLRNARNALRRHAPSGDIVLVAIDDRSLLGIDTWPWPRRYHARIADKLREAGAHGIFYDIDFSSKSGPDDAVFAEALARWRGRATLATQVVRNGEDRPTTLVPIPELEDVTKKAGINVDFDYRGAVWKVPYVFESGGRQVPSMAAAIAGVLNRSAKNFPLDYAINVKAIPVLSAIDVLDGRTSIDVAGKDILIGTMSTQIGDYFLLPSAGRLPGVLLHALGAETLKSGIPSSWGWSPALLLAIAASVSALWARRLRVSLGIAGGALVALIILPVLLEARLIFVDVVPGLLLVLAVTASLLISRVRKNYRARGKTDAVSGLPNLAALREQADGGVLIAARIGNWSELAAALSVEDEAAVVEQIKHRLALGGSQSALYQGDEGVFAWFAPADGVASASDHLEALHGFFRSPLNVRGRTIDARISFGMDGGHDRSIANRLAGALLAADEAAAEGLRWKTFDTATLADASWKLSLLGQLDQAVDNGELWVAYQAKLDLKTGVICGAEALVRWTHPTKGAIAPLDFILVAEQHDRIERLTRFVLEEAVRAAAEINRAGLPFGVAVNLSTRMMAVPGFPRTVADLLARHGLRPGQLTLEVTETAAMGSGGGNLRTLHALCGMGVIVSIDDYGTGLSTLEYLKKIPSNEIKIDQGFVANVTRNRSDRLMVHSTIELVHSLGQSVVAEGVEDQATLELLAEMGCDYAQGFWIGRPVPLHEFARTMLAQQHKFALSSVKVLQG